MKSFTYLLVDFLTVIICFIASFDKRIRFDRHFLNFLKAAILVAIPFLIWDEWFVRKSVWWFNTDYTLGINFGSLPLEEYLFFICIPFACLFTFFCIDKFFNLNFLEKYNSAVIYYVILLCIIGVTMFYNKLYPCVTFIVAGLTLILYLVLKSNWIAKATFVYVILLPGFFLVNGVLTGTGLDSPIVNYNAEEIIGIRFGTIPMEDSIYGYANFLLVIGLFKHFAFKTLK